MKNYKRFLLAAFILIVVGGIAMWLLMPGFTRIMIGYAIRFFGIELIQMPG